MPGQFKGKPKEGTGSQNPEMWSAGHIPIAKLYINCHPQWCKVVHHAYLLMRSVQRTAMGC